MAEDGDSIEFRQLLDLRPDVSGYNVNVKVLESKLVHDKQGRGGASPVRISECLVADTSGSVVFTARNDQVDLLQPGSYLALLGAKVDMFHGCMRLVVDPKSGGRVEPSKVKPFEAKEDFNLSLVEYELVHVPLEAT